MAHSFQCVFLGTRRYKLRLALRWFHTTRLRRSQLESRGAIRGKHVQSFRFSSVRPLLSSDTNAYFTGDLVAVSSTPSALGTTIAPYVAASNYVALGVFMGCEFFSPTVGRNVWSATFPGSVGSSNIGNAYICTDPDQRYIAQVSTTSAIFNSSWIGLGVTLATSGSGNTTTGQSAQAIASSVTPTVQSATCAFKVIDVYQNWAPPGTNGTSSGAEGAQIVVLLPNDWFRNSLNAAST